MATYDVWAGHPSVPLSPSTTNLHSAQNTILPLSYITHPLHNQNFHFIIYSEVQGSEYGIH
jgi:hypothetical protein